MRKYIVGIAVVAVLFGGWIAWIHHWYKSLEPPGPTYGDVLTIVPEPQDPVVFKFQGREYLAVCGPWDTLPRFPSGPPMYVFDDQGNLVGWTPDIGDDDGFWGRWTPKVGHWSITREEALAWPRGK